MRKVGIVLLAAALSGCMHQSIPQAFSHAVTDKPADCVPAVYGEKADPTHRQYCDERRRRFFYFDRVKKQYFWESGEPK